MELAEDDPEYHNSREDLWEQFISKTDQIFMVLCGHQGGQALRVEENDYGHTVYQILSDFQERGQAGLDAGQAIGRGGKVTGIGDGWLREMTFHLDADHPRVDVRTYSSHYDAYSKRIGNVCRVVQKKTSNQICLTLNLRKLMNTRSNYRTSIAASSP